MRRIERKQATRVGRERRHARTRWIAIGSALMLAAAGLIGWTIYRAQQPATYATPAQVDNDGGPDGGILAASEGGSVPVEVYFDFMCVACKQFEAALTPTLNRLLAEKKITLVWHPVNLLDGLSVPAGYSTRAASAAGCAAATGRLKAYGEALFDRQPAPGGPGLNDDQLVDLGGLVGLNAPAFAKCVRALPYRDWVNHVSALAGLRAVTRTPALYVAQHRLAAPTPATLTAAVATLS